MTWLSVDPSSQVSSQFRPASVVRTGQAALLPPSSINLLGRSVNENSPNGFSIGNAQTTNEVQASFTLTDDAGGLFQITTGGNLQVAGSLNHEINASHDIIIRAENSGGFVEVSFTINVLDINEAPSSFSVSDFINNGGRVEIDIALIGNPFCTISNNDPDIGDAQTFSLDADLGGAISINPSTGVVTLDDVTGLNEGDNTFIVRSTDTGGLQATGTIPVRIISTVVNEANAFTDGTNWNEAGDAGLWSDQIAA